MNRVAIVFLTFALAFPVFGQGTGMTQFKALKGADYVNTSNSVTALAAEAAQRRAADAGLTNYVTASVVAQAAKQGTTNDMFQAWFSALQGRTNAWNAAYGWGDWSARMGALDGRTNAWNAAAAAAGYAYSPTNPPPSSGDYAAWANNASNAIAATRLETSTGYNGIDAHRNVWALTGAWILAVPGQGYTGIVSDAGNLWPWPDPTEPVIEAGDYSIYTSSYFPLPVPGLPVYFFPVIDIFGPGGASWSASGGGILSGLPWLYEFDTLELPLIDGPAVGSAYLSWAADGGTTNIGTLALSSQIIDPAAASYFGVDSGGPVEVGSPAAVTSVGDWDFDGDTLSNPAGTVDASAFKISGNPLIIPPTNNPAFTGTLILNGSPIGETTPTYIGIATQSVISVTSGTYCLDLTDWPATGSTWAASVAWAGTPELTVTGRYEFVFTACGDRLNGRQTWPALPAWQSAPVTTKAGTTTLNEVSDLLTSGETNNFVLVASDIRGGPSLVRLCGYVSDPAARSPQATLELGAYRHYAGATVTNGYPSVLCPTNDYGWCRTVAVPQAEATAVAGEPVSLKVRAWRTGTASGGTLKITRCMRRDLNALESAAYGAGWRP